MTNHFPIENTFTTQLFEDEVVKRKESTPFFSLLLTVKRSDFGSKRSSALDFVEQNFGVTYLKLFSKRFYKYVTLKSIYFELQQNGNSSDINYVVLLQIEVSLQII